MTLIRLNAQVPTHETLWLLHDYLDFLSKDNRRINSYVQAIMPDGDADIVVLTRLCVVIGMCYEAKLLGRGQGRRLLNRMWNNDLEGLDQDASILYEDDE